jgi:hypothetical protein
MPFARLIKRETFVGELKPEIQIGDIYEYKGEVMHGIAMNNETGEQKFVDVILTKNKTGPEGWGYLPADMLELIPEGKEN